MIRPAHQGIEVWLCVEPVDFRKQITGLARTGRGHLELGLEATRREAANDDAPEHAVAARLRARW